MRFGHIVAALCGMLIFSGVEGAELTRPDLESWLDGFLPYALQTADIAGGVVAVVKDGEVVLQKGYGYSDAEKKTPVDPERTLFRPGSVSKLFTYTAVMQLVEQGKLDLDKNVNTYLDFKLPDAYDRPVTLRHLMTHTAGFEESLRRLIGSNLSAFDSLETYVKNTKPERIFPPGEIPSYCNYCVSLAGYIVQRVSGESYDDYLDHHVFQPLGMQHATSRQPLPQPLAPDMSKGYKVGSGPAQYFEFVGAAPAGSVSATGADMARFMIAHLQAPNGDGKLFSASTAQRMYTTMFRAAPPSNGMALGFFERSRNGHRIIGHGGDTDFFHSDLLLFIDDGVGLFMSFNSSGKDEAVQKVRSALFEKFTDRYFPAAVLQEPTSATALEHAQAVAGRYGVSRRAESSFFSALNSFSQLQVVANPDGTIVIPPVTYLNGAPKQWREVAPYVWREVGGPQRLAAQMRDGKVRLLSLDEIGGIQAFLPVSASQSAAWQLPAMILAIVALLLTVILWPIAALTRRHFKVPFTLSPRAALSYRLVRIAALLQLAVLFGWALIIQAGLSDLQYLDGRLDLWIGLLRLLGIVCLLGAIVFIWNASLVWRTPGHKWSKAWSIVLIAAGLLLSAFALSCHLVGFGVRY
jgi:CubicO group peptidase (beta-lactamase class C family)